ncbi:hypothetical protein GQ55_6G188900 [Panicum hallii var. hallii]|uniref:Uncharacterized protein n=1 Tax=Panicum hallii var. hallii TaxID=1504633 RepID=A0A2T7D7A0_9POAL|nr:hypothetical protein GQ55_6G188900 [Panicum hallii var. hallii]
MDAAAVIAAATAPPPSPPWRPDLAAAKALMLLCLASLWVGFAAAGAAAVTVAASGHGEASPVFRVLAETTVKATALALLLAPVSMVLVLRATVCDAGFREELIRHGQASRASARSMLREAIVRAFIAALAFALLRVIGSLVLMGLSPAKGSRTGRVCEMLVVVGQVGSTSSTCFIILPLMALKLWRMKPGAIAGSNV